MDLALLSRVQHFPVRHHSPRTTAVLLKWLERVKPAVVLVEGPCDATALVDVLCDKQTRPPVAILGYRTDGTPSSSLWPFAAYSPEYQALKWARANGARAEFIDIPVGVSLAVDRHVPGPGVETEATEGSEPVPDEAIPLTEAFARSQGFRSFEEFWEASFEAPDWSPEQFRPVLTAWADVVNAGPRLAYHRQRDAFMARKVLEVVAGGVAPEKVAVVAGAAHTAAFLAGDVDPKEEAKLPAAGPCAVTVIPYSFPRLAEQLGYGAGNRAPHFYQKAHEANCDFRRATLEVLLDFASHLRMRGFSASLSDVLEAYRLAVTLSDLREKSAPGLDELREATVATLCRGDATHVDSFLWKSVIGHEVGQVASRIGQNSLQAEFWREVGERRLPRTDSPETFTLRLNNPVEVGSSVFLHRLRVAGIPYASLSGTGSSRKQGAEAEAGGYAALTRVREAWQAQWTPSTDVALVEKIVLGDSLEGVTTRVLQERLTQAKTTAEAADVLLESVITGCSQTVAQALKACDALAATDADLPSLASAARALSGLMAYGTSRAHSDVGDEAVAALGEKTFGRALLRVREASACAPEGVPPVLEALRTLHEVALSQPRADKEGWLAEARGLMGSHAVHPSTSGLATGLLYLARELPEADVALEVGRRLSAAVEPSDAAAYLEGFLQVNALVLVKSRDVVKALDDFLTSVEPERFRQTLPVLRRALGALGATERRYLMENVMGVRQLKDKGRAVKAVLEEKDKATLKDLSADLGKALDDLDDLL
ncbi:DUF5682 family protein [Corallococcus exiguus]|uniref:Uncharacterized protein n=1 Tax=Corallococcus exiguus TaxID=83462 RepID=A0A7X4Y4X7_9BACT|nr:DUF5682 family protein [Corallococcus exiguus]NBC38913.1 hypothetical protein [Corallococcus exiguus]TNV65274.1 hypothetical protein FH620_10240 [Corallococcus exiguus]